MESLGSVSFFFINKHFYLSRMHYSKVTVKTKLLQGKSISKTVNVLLNVLFMIFFFENVSISTTILRSTAVFNCFLNTKSAY